MPAIQKSNFFDGSTKLCNQLYANDRLAANSNSLFSVPNTIYAAYCFDPAHKNGATNDVGIQWDQNIAGLNSLGFRVETFDNSAPIGNNAAPTGVQKKAQFVNEPTTLSSAKQIHGLYIVSHGSTNSFFIPQNVNSTWGPSWSLDYMNNFDDVNAPNDEDSWTIAGALGYHLGAIVVHACESFTGARRLSSDPCA